MKKLSFILLAVMLITALFVSCKAEVIDDSDLVDIRFTTDGNAKGLNWSRPAFDANDYVWYYSAIKGDGGPTTGQTLNGDKIEKELVGETGKLTESEGPFSQGKWEFTLYGYAKDENGSKTDVLVYSGSGECTLTREVSTVGIQVEALVSGIGSGKIVVSKDVSLVVNRNKSFAPTNVSVRTSDDKPIEGCSDQAFDAANGNSFTLKSGSYKVTIERIADGLTYASNSIYVTVYDGQTTTISGTLDEITTSTRFEAEDGTIRGKAEADLFVDKATTLSIKDFPAPGATTSVTIPHIYGSQKAVLNVVAYPSSLVAKAFGFDTNESVPFAGMDFTLTVGGNIEDYFGFSDACYVEVTTYINKGLDGSKLKLIYNGPEAKNEQTFGHRIEKYDENTGMLVFKTNHFGQFFVSSDEVVALSATGNGAYTSLQYAINDAKDGDTISILKDMDVPTTVSVDNKTIVLDFNGKTLKNTEYLWDESKNNWSLISVRGTNGNLTITGNGTLNAKEDDCYAVDVQDGATLTIEDGTFIGNIHAVYVEKGKAFINGGSYSVRQKYPESGKDYEFVLNCWDENRANDTAKIVVTGGTFEKFNPADCYAEGANTNFLEEGYEVVADNDFYTVVRSNWVKTFDELQNAAKDGLSCKLADDINATDTIEVSKNFKIDLNGSTIKFSTSNDLPYLFSVDGGEFEISNGTITVSGKGLTGVYITTGTEKASVKKVTINLNCDSCIGFSMNGNVSAKFDTVTVSSDKQNKNYGFKLTGGSKAELNGCKFTLTENGSNTNVRSFSVQSESSIEMKSCEVYGGKFEISGGKAIIHEGSITSFDPSGYLADSCRSEKNTDDGTWKVSLKGSTPNPDPELGDEP